MASGYRMKTIELNTGDTIPAIGLGTWKLTEEQAETVIPMALEMGYRHLDGARIYENEAAVGRGIQAGLANTGLARTDLWITSKLWNDAHRPEHVLPALKQTLSDLSLDELDLYLIHWPVAQRPGCFRPEVPEDYLTLDEVPLAETWQAMADCQQQGLCRNIGVSNFSQLKLESLIADTGVVPAVNQVESHPYLAQTELLEFCQQQGIALTAYSPLGSGDRPDGMRQLNEPHLLSDPTVVQWAQQLDRTPAQILLAWALQRDTVAIPKSAHRDHLQQNLDAVTVELPAESIEAINRLDRHHRYVDGTFWEIPGGPYTAANVWDE